MSAVIATGIGFGDSCKGTAALVLTRLLNAHTNVKTGGGQGGQVVHTRDGVEFKHSHFGGGTLAGADTFLSREMVIVGARLYEEATELNALGVDAWKRLTIDSEALISTHWHVEANRFREMARNHSHGTTGMGIGETIRDAKRGLALRASDLIQPSLLQKLIQIAETKKAEIAHLVERFESENPQLRDAEWRTYPGMEDDYFEILRDLARNVRIVDGKEHLQQIMSRDGDVVFQASQGAAISRLCGFHPYTTTSIPTPDAPRRLLAEIGYDGGITQLGLIRAYMIRHGAGPFPTESHELTELLPDPNNGENQWQGKFRIGQFDAVMLHYTIAACGGSAAFSGLIVSCVDQLEKIPQWQIATSYLAPGVERAELEKYFELDGDSICGIRVHEDDGTDTHLAHQQRLGELLFYCVPQFNQVERSTESYLEKIEELLQVPVIITGHGPSESDRRIRKNIWVRP